MKDDQLKNEFKASVELINSFTKPLPADLLLKLYAYYKIANKNKKHPGSRTPLINAFKANALFQVKDIDREKAMQEYINLVKKEVSN